MILKGKLSRICPGITFTYDVINNILGRPVTKDGVNIGIICMVDPDRDELCLDIDDEYSKYFLVDKITSFEVVGGAK